MSATCYTNTGFESQRLDIRFSYLSSSSYISEDGSLFLEQHSRWCGGGIARTDWDYVLPPFRSRRYTGSHSREPIEYTSFFFCRAGLVYSDFDGLQSSSICMVILQSYRWTIQSQYLVGFAPCRCSPACQIRFILYRSTSRRNRSISNSTRTDLSASFCQVSCVRRESHHIDVLALVQHCDKEQIARKECLLRCSSPRPSYCQYWC